MHRYAWLELEDGMWHLLTHIAAIPEESDRRWSDRDRALAELKAEGWAIVRPYDASVMEDAERIHGYGLARRVWNVPLPTSWPPA